MIRGRKGGRERGEEVGGGPIASPQSTDGSLTPTELSTGQGKEREAERKLQKASVHLNFCERQMKKPNKHKMRGSTHSER